MKNLVKASVLLCAILGFAACNNDNGEPVYSIYDEPAVVESVGELPVIRTPYGKYSVPSLASVSLEQGSLLWVAFTVDMNDQPNQEVPNAQNFKYIEIDSTQATMPADVTEFEACLSDSYSDSIEVAMLYNTYIDEMLFFKFTQKAADDQKFTYELICNPAVENGEDVPTLYIRAKKVDAENAPTAKASTEKNTVFGIKMSNYISYYKEKFSGTVKFNLKYKTGTDKDGKDIYKAFKSNPIVWDVK
ncbi:MAG: hypothetical protein LBN93_10090 [Candidatus Symbiothrix sp.]|jgi:hypothetical protein|nr:hypothetical protein [Candidatus Symbiothrix sp.]